MRWSEYQIFQLMMLCPFMTTKDAASYMRMSEEVIKSAAQRFGVVKAGWYYKPPSRYSTRQQSFILKNYLILPVKTIAERIGGSYTGVIGVLNREGISIPNQIIEQHKRDSQIKKGNIPPNKGKKMSRRQYALCAPTMFKPGQKSHNELENGVITIRHNHKERNSPPYKWIRIKKDTWKMLHVFNWEKKHGPVSPGMIIVFKNKDTLNCEIENLDMITREQNMLRNTIHRYPLKLKKEIRALHRLKRTIKKYGKEQDNRFA